jgi:hypothetical protein
MPRASSRGHTRGFVHTVFLDVTRLSLASAIIVAVGGSTALATAPHASNIAPKVGGDVVHAKGTTTAGNHPGSSTARVKCALASLCPSAATTRQRAECHQHRQQGHSRGDFG